LILKIYDAMGFKFSTDNFNQYVLIVVLLIMFLYSYRKQTKYITDRIKANNKKI